MMFRGARRFTRPLPLLVGLPLLVLLSLRMLASPNVALSMPDAAMQPTYARLAARAAEAASKLPAGGRWWCAIAGGPGAGKSTLAEAVAEVCEKQHGVPTAVLPMDGFHYSRAELARLDPPDAPRFLPRRGAPHTFNAAGLAEALASAKASGEAEQLPMYSRELSDPVPGGAVLSPDDRIVLVEGNYLLLGALLRDAQALEESAADFPDIPSLADEAARWAPLLALFDEAWFVAPPGGVATQRERLVARHLQTWSDAKTAAWGASTAEEGAAKRTDFNDVPNARLIELCRAHADLVIDSV
mmetsp:Transcript_154977/g.496707  ORF Transcript_154977/g.496707 Transcript_154977/m.496707 type:complete len:300 (-) Transcript_154977:288-1187(-)